MNVGYQPSLRPQQCCETGMMTDPMPENEEERLQVLRKSKLIDDPNLDAEIRKYCEMAVRIFRVSDIVNIPH